MERDRLFKLLVTAAAATALSLAVSQCKSAEEGAPTSANYSKVKSGRWAKLHIVAVRSGCSAGNPLYRINDFDTEGSVSIKVCREARRFDSFTRDYKNHSVVHPGLDLGCDLDGVAGKQQFTIQWMHPGPASAPTDMSDARNVVLVRKLSCGSNGCSWMLGNWHYFKQVTVEYLYRNETHTDTIDPITEIPALGFSSEPPTITRVDYDQPYDSVYCLGSLDTYPDIPVVDK